jgi:hypothetical protein
MDIGSSAVVDYSLLHPKVKGLSPTSASGTVREMTMNMFTYDAKSWLTDVSEW